MEQRLIVEGKDAIVLTNIFMKRKMNPPLGYHNFQKYKSEFVVEAKGIDKVKFALVEELESPDVKNIGIIVDADDKGAVARFDFIKSVIEETLKVSLPNLTLTENVCTLEHLKLTLGIWVMPDNKNNGYLEHFVSNLIPQGNKTWEFANEKVEELSNKSFSEFTEIKKQKALIHTYLAWQASPGMPMGTAVQAKYFDASSTSADNLAKWFEDTFELGK